MPSGYPWPLSKRREVLDAVASGMPMLQAYRVCGVSFATVREWWVQAAGMGLLKSGRGGNSLRVVPDPDRLGGSGRRLSLDERISIQHGRDLGWSVTGIAASIGRDKSVVSRELARNTGSDGVYHARVADVKAAVRARRPKGRKLDQDRLCEKIAQWMDQGWSPGLIAKVLRQDHPDDRGAWVSHETIYRSLYVQSRGSLRADLYKRLSTHRASRKPRERVGAAKGGRPFKDALKISQRPPEVADRAVPGHWEGDLILGTGNTSAIGTLVERSTRYTILLHLPVDHTAETVASAMVSAMGDLPAHLRRSLTWDRGSEMAGYVDVQLDLQMPVYFADPHSPWQRGSNENTNRLLRHWFEKGTDLSGWGPEDLKRVATMLNARPRPTLDLKTPAQALQELLAQAA
jgi:IS30 family transposase